jgi:hypothetical protein
VEVDDEPQRHDDSEIRLSRNTERWPAVSGAASKSTKEYKT